MNKTLIVGEHAQGKLNVSTAKCVNCAKAIPQGEIDVVLLGSDLTAVSAQAAALEGVHKVLTLQRPENAEPLAAVFAPQIAALAKNYSHVFGPSTT
jgi:electron transfer flavoprotein alpha subunit